MRKLWSYCWKFALVLAATNIDAANLLQNSSFELPARTGYSWNSSNWLGVPLANAKSQDFSNHGDYSWLLFGNGTTNSQRVISKPYRLDVGTTYTFSAYVRRGTGGSANVRLRIENVADTSDGTWSGSVFPPTGSWERQSVSHTVTASTAYRVIVAITNQGISNAEAYVDNLQLEIGSSATAWEPRANVEVGWGQNEDHWGNTFHLADNVTIPLHLYNYTGNSAIVDVDMKSRDWFNEQDLSVNESTPINVNPGLTTIQQSFDNMTYGWHRVEAWLRNQDMSGDEVTYSVLPTPVALTTQSNSLFGGHSKAIPYWLRQAKAIGMNWVRTLSGVGISSPNPFRWSYAEPSQGNYRFYDQDIQHIRDEGLLILACLGESPSATPSWAKDGSGMPIISNWQDYVTAMVSHYKDDVDHWEIFNEPNLVMAGQQQRNFELHEAAHPIIHALDPGSVVVGPVVSGGSFFRPGQSSNKNYGTNVIMALGGSNYVEVLSHHTYSVEEVANDFAALKGVTAVAEAVGKEAWNSEIGGRMSSGFQTILYEDIIHADGGRFHQNIRNHRIRGLWTIQNFGRMSNLSLTKQFYYDGRSRAALDHLAEFTIFDWDQSLRPFGASYATMTQFFEEGTKAGNIVQGDAEVYVFSTPRNNSAAVAMGELHEQAARSKLWRLTTTDNANSTFYNAVGNVIPYGSGVEFSSTTPVWITSTTATNTFMSSITITQISDTTPPNLDITSGPRGTVTDTTDRYFRWYAEDNAGRMTDFDDSDAIEFRYRLNGGSWSAWSIEFGVTYPSITSSGTFDVEARDPAGNIATAQWVWPTAAEPPPVYPSCVTLP